MLFTAWSEQFLIQKSHYSAPLFGLPAEIAPPRHVPPNARRYEDVGPAGFTPLSAGKHGPEPLEHPWAPGAFENPVHSGHYERIRQSRRSRAKS